MPADQFETLVYQVGVQHVGLAVIAYAHDIAGQVAVPHLGAAHAHLAGETQQGGDLVQPRGGTRLITGQHVHHIGMALVVAAEVVVPLEVLVVGPGIPVTRRGNAVDQAAIVNHRQIKPGTVPGHQRRCKTIDAVEETRQQFLLGRIRIAQ